MGAEWTEWGNERASVVGLTKEDDDEEAAAPPAAAAVEEEAIEEALVCDEDAPPALRLVCDVDERDGRACVATEIGWPSATCCGKALPLLEAFVVIFSM